MSPIPFRADRRVRQSVDRGRTAMFGVAGAAMLALSACHGAPRPVDLVVRNVTLVSPERPAPLRDAWVAIDGERIVGVGQGAPPHRARTDLDGRGRFLTPGLIDGHVHLAGIPGLAAMAADAPPHLRPAIDAYERQLPRSYLYFGFTTVIDLNVVDPGFLERFAAAPLGPDLHHCGGGLALANGYPMVFLPPESRFEYYPNFLWDDRHADEIPAGHARADHTPEATVAKVAADGGICVKTHWEDGFGPAAIWPTPPRETIDAVAAAARARGLTVTMHANSLAAHRFATDAGVDVIVHGLWNWDGLQGTDSGLPGPIESLLREQVARGIGVMPTTRVLGGLRDLFDPGFLDDPRLAAVVPAPLLEWYRSAEAGAFADELRRDFGGAPDAVIRDRMEATMAGAQQVVAFLVRHDAKLLFGSDTPSAPTYANPPGLNGALELELLAAAGATPRQIFEAATIANARAFHLDGDVGTVEAGKVANLLLLDADPLASAAAWSTLTTVIVRGKAVQRTALAAREP